MLCDTRYVGHDCLTKLEKALPEGCELLVRTNHDPDGCSGAPMSEGRWFVHLQLSSGHKSTNDIIHESLYCEYGDDLFLMLMDVCKIVNDIKRVNQN